VLNDHRWRHAIYQHDVGSTLRSDPGPSHYKIRFPAPLSAYRRRSLHNLCGKTLLMKCCHLLKIAWCMCFQICRFYQATFYWSKAERLSANSCRAFDFIVRKMASHAVPEQLYHEEISWTQPHQRICSSAVQQLWPVEIPEVESSLWQGKTKASLIIV